MSALNVPDVAAYDLATNDKIPVIRELMAAEGVGLGLDIGIGTGYTTARVFGDRATVCVDVEVDNLRLYRDGAERRGHRALCVMAAATALPFRSGAFRFVLCSEVLEHLDDDRTAAGELSRVLAAGGRAVITVPYTGLGFTSFLELLRVRTVHDFPGPEYHVRRGYDEGAIEALFHPHRVSVVRHAYYFRLFTRLAADTVSLGHLLYQRLVHRRRAWTWSQAAAARGGIAFALYARAYPALRAVGTLDRLLRRARGFGLVVALTKSAAGTGRA